MGGPDRFIAAGRWIPGHVEADGSHGELVTDADPHREPEIRREEVARIPHGTGVGDVNALCSSRSFNEAAASMPRKTYFNRLDVAI